SVAGASDFGKNYLNKRVRGSSEA
nr:NSP11 [Turkey coronavirus]